MASPGGQVYFCHQCQRTVRPASSVDLVCPECESGFLEELTSSFADATTSLGRNLSPWNLMGAGDGAEEGPGASALQGMMRRPMPASSPALAQLLEAMSTFYQQIQATQLTLGQDADWDGGGRNIVATDIGDINPMLLLRGRMQNILGGRNAEFFIDNGAGGGPEHLQGNIGDYFFGPGLEQLIQQLAENDPNRYGAPPASKSAVEGLPTIKISEEHLGTDAAQCAVCKDEFELCSEVKQMPCKHMYHPDCILPWLAQHNSCPVCRYELPTDDSDYEQARAQGLGAASSSGNVSSGGAQDGEGNRGPGGFTLWQNISDNAGTSNSSQADDSGGSRGGGVRTGRRFSIAFPWFRSAATTSQAHRNVQSEGSRQAYSAEIVSSGPAGEGNDTSGQNMRASTTNEDDDTLMSGTTQEELD